MASEAAPIEAPTGSTILTMLLRSNRQFIERLGQAFSHRASTSEMYCVKPLIVDAAGFEFAKAWKTPERKK